eukprot:s10746_g2.t1
MYRQGGKPNAAADKGGMNPKQEDQSGAYIVEGEKVVRIKWPGLYGLRLWLRADNWKASPQTSSSSWALSGSYDLTSSSHAAMPYRADVIGYDQESVFSPVIFQIRVAHDTGVHFVWHRYNAFKQLSAYLSHRFPALPALQGGHLWQKAVNSAGFLKSRQQCLTSFLQAALTIDADVEDLILREFLGIASPALAELSGLRELGAQPWPILLELGALGKQRMLEFRGFASYDF